MSLRGRDSECALLDGLVSAIRRGESRALVLCGEAGIGKTALLEYLVEAAFSATARVAEVARTATYSRAYEESNGFMTLLSDGERLTGAYALGPEAGEWLQQATLAIRARVPLEVLRDTIQPFPTFSEIYVAALESLHSRIAATRGRGASSAGADSRAGPAT